MAAARGTSPRGPPQLGHGDRFRVTVSDGTATFLHTATLGNMRPYGRSTLRKLAAGTHAMKGRMEKRNCSG